MRRRIWFSIVGVVAVLAIVVGINMFADARLAYVHVDLTENHIYTLSPGTRQILKGLKQPITLRLFYSRLLGSTVPPYGSYADRVREMLEQYAAVADGKIRLEFYDPEPFSRVEDQALADGLQGVPVDQAGTQVYFGLAGSNMLDDERTIPFFQTDRERFLEYDLTKLVYELSSPKRPVVAVMSSLPLDGNPQLMMMTHGQQGGQPFASTELLRQTNTVKMIPPDTQAIDPGIDVLLVAEAQHLSENTLYAIDQFVMRGGRLMVMVDPWCETMAAQSNPSGMPVTDAHSNLAKLFKAWGIEFNPNEVVGDLTGAWRVRDPQDPNAQAVNYVAWFNIRDGINHSDPATADLKQVTVASPGFIAKVPGAKIAFTPLLTSSANSGLIPVDQVKMPDPGKILANFKPEGGPRVIAARIRGVLRSAFTGPPPEPNGKPRPANFPAYKAETSGPADMVVVADADILADRFWVRVSDFFGQQTALPFSDNGPLVANLVDTLAGGEALIGLRARGDSSHPFTLVNTMQAEAEAKFRRTEQALQQHLDNVQKQLQALRQGGNPGDTEQAANAQAVITPAQRMAIDAARRDIVETREKLRAVQYDLNRDITRLENELRMLDIIAVPAVLTLIAIAMGVVLRRQRARARG
ncbi:MAG TPA: GldG family protein [Acetobacteraceae bacterium]|nr:GldG family protein [Acetobacteraceae bacterium]